MAKYEFVLVGAGISSLMCACKLKETLPGAKICLLEKGRPLNERLCPIIEKQADKCVKCDPCAIVSGVAGAGSKNDGKFVMPSRDSIDYGGWLGDYLPSDTVIDYINEVDSILTKFADKEYPLYNPSVKFKQECLKYDLHLRTARIRHYGSDGISQVMANLVQHLESSGVEFVTGAFVSDMDIEQKQVFTTKGTFGYEKLIIGAGRTGAPWFIDFCSSHGIPLKNNRVDIGVRVEIPSEICHDIAKTIYEPKIYYRSKGYGDLTRTFCWNNGDARVCIENNEGVLSVNGFSNSAGCTNSGNSNFALLTSINFSSPFRQPVEYARYIASLSNMISGGSVLVQRLGDLKLGRRTNEARLRQSTTIPTLKTAVAGDISLALPKRILDDIIETLDALNNVIKGINNYDTLLYSPEIKTYSARPEFISEHFKIAKDIYAIGDCSSCTRSLSQAGAMGLVVAKNIKRS